MTGRLPLTALALLLGTLLGHGGALPVGVARQPVVFSGGHETDPVDHGRPVVLIAAALGVPTEVFREAFTHVHPVRDGGPTREQAQANKAALMSALEKYGVNNDRLDAVSNYYRYRPQMSELWTHRDASANALVKDGSVIGYEITAPGAGYSAPPVVSVPGIKNATAKVELVFGKTLESNGSIATIKVKPAK
ncbi:hypothetical protein BH09VER1_BH09VER1_22900 [soil metagenome]